MEASFRIVYSNIEICQMCMTGSIKENVIRFQVTAITVRWLMNIMWRIGRTDVLCVVDGGIPAHKRVLQPRT